MWKDKIKTKQCGPSTPEECRSEANFCSINSNFMNITDELVKYRIHSVLRGNGYLTSSKENDREAEIGERQKKSCSLPLVGAAEEAGS